MASFGKRSRTNRDTCTEELQDVLDEAIKGYDFSIIWGHRDKEAQNRAFEEGFSNLSWPRSKHNQVPSEAFDVVPYPMGFQATNEQFYEMATYILQAASSLGIRVRWGGHWKGLRDMAHFELL